MEDNETQDIEETQGRSFENVSGYDELQQQNDLDQYNNDLANGVYGNEPSEKEEVAEPTIEEPVAEENETESTQEEVGEESQEKPDSEYSQFMDDEGNFLVETEQVVELFNDATGMNFRDIDSIQELIQSGMQVQKGEQELNGLSPEEREMVLFSRDNNNDLSLYGLIKSSDPSTWDADEAIKQKTILDNKDKNPELVQYLVKGELDKYKPELDEDGEVVDQNQARKLELLKADAAQTAKAYFSNLKGTLSDYNGEKALQVEQEQKQESNKKWITLVDTMLNQPPETSYMVGDSEVKVVLDKENFKEVQSIMDDPGAFLKEVIGFDVETGLPDAEKLYNFALREVYFDTIMSETYNNGIADSEIKQNRVSKNIGDERAKGTKEPPKKQKTATESFWGI